MSPWGGAQGSLPTPSRLCPSLVLVFLALSLRLLSPTPAKLPPGHPLSKRVLIRAQVRTVRKRPTGINIRKGLLGSRRGQGQGAGEGRGGAVGSSAHNPSACSHARAEQPGKRHTWTGQPGERGWWARADRDHPNQSEGVAAGTPLEGILSSHKKALGAEIALRPLTTACVGLSASAHATTSYSAASAEQGGGTQGKGRRLRPGRRRVLRGVCLQDLGRECRPLSLGPPLRGLSLTPSPRPSRLPQWPSSCPPGSPSLGPHLNLWAAALPPASPLPQPWPQPGARAERGSRRLSLRLRERERESVGWRRRGPRGVRAAGTPFGTPSGVPATEEEGRGAMLLDPPASPGPARMTPRRVALWDVSNTAPRSPLGPANVGAQNASLPRSPLGAAFGNANAIATSHAHASANAGGSVGGAGVQRSVGGRGRVGGSGKSALKGVGRKGERGASHRGAPLTQVCIPPRKVLEPEAISPARRALAYAPAPGTEPLTSLDLGAENVDPGKKGASGGAETEDGDSGTGRGRGGGRPRGRGREQGAVEGRRGTR